MFALIICIGTVFGNYTCIGFKLLILTDHILLHYSHGNVHFIQLGKVLLLEIPD